MEAIAARGHVVDGEAAVVPRLREVAVLHHQHVRHHARMHVAVHAHEARMGEGVALRLTAPVEPEVETVGLAHGKDVVIERIVVRKADRRAHRHDDDMRRVGLVGDCDFNGRGLRRRGDCGGGFEIEHGITEVGRGLVVLLENHDMPSHPTGG